MGSYLKTMGTQFIQHVFFALYLIALSSLLSSNSASALDRLESNSPNCNILKFFWLVINWKVDSSLFCIFTFTKINIVLITIDTLRADHLSCYGYERTTSPNIDAIAEKGIVFSNTIAPSSWTAPSMVSLFTSVYPINHGVVHGFIKNGKTILNQEVFSHPYILLTMEFFTASTIKRVKRSTYRKSSLMSLEPCPRFYRKRDMVPSGLPPICI